MDTDWLDYLPLQGQGPDLVEQEELICCRKRGRGSMDHRIVPRLPLTAMIQRMKLLDDSVSSGKQRGSRGRARILQDRAKSSRPHGLKQKEKEKPIKREVTETIYDDNQINERNDPTYNHQWRQNDFPSLGIEHTTEGSPKKKCRSMIGDSREYKDVIVTTNEVDPEINNLEVKEPRLSFPVNKIHHSSVETVLNKPKLLKKEKKEKFDFTKANQKLLQEFPIVKSGPKVYSLTQHNLEKFLRESDTESSCSSLDMTCSTSENLDDLPLYERYAVTLDDIKKSKAAAKVPPKVKGHLANLLEAMDSYCENPEAYFNNQNKTVEDSGEGAGSKEVLSNKNLESIVSNASVVSDMSNLNSPSENNVDNENNREGKSLMEDIENTDVVVSTNDNADSETVELSNRFVNCEDEKFHECDKGHTEGEESNSLQIEMDVNIQSSDKKEECEVKENYCEKQKTEDRIAKLDKIDLQSEPVSPVFNNNRLDNDLNGFQKVVRKQSKKRTSPTFSKRNFSPDTKDKSVWRIYGTNAIQVDGLPEACDISELQGMVAGFGTVIDFQIRAIDSGTSVRFKLNNKDACEYAVQCLDDTDCLFPESNCKLTCHQLHT